VVGGIFVLRDRMGAAQTGPRQNEPGSKFVSTGGGQGGDLTGIELRCSLGEFKDLGKARGSLRVGGEIDRNISRDKRKLAHREI